MLGEDNDDDVEETDEGPGSEPGEEVSLEFRWTEETTEDDSGHEACYEGDSEVLEEKSEENINAQMVVKARRGTRRREERTITTASAVFP